MGNNKYLSEELRLKIVEMYNNGRKQNQIASILSISKGTVSKILKKFSTSGSVKTKPKSGRPKKKNKF